MPRKIKYDDINFGRHEGVALKEYFETILKELRIDYEDKISKLEDKIELQFEMSKESINKSEQAINLRLQTLNEFRNAMKDQQATFITRVEYDTKHENIVQKIEILEKMMYVGLGVLLAIEFAFKFFIK